MRVRTVVWTVVTALALGLCMAGNAIAMEEKIDKSADIKQHKIVRVHYLAGLSPEELKIEPGTTVIWINDARASMYIQFEGKQVTMACKSPVHFIVDETGSFLSDNIPQGSVASLCFVEKGEFSYYARKAPTYSSQEHREGIKGFSGKIIVE